MGLTDLSRRRLCAQGISCPSITPEEAVAGLTAVQAQDRPSSLWAIGLRARVSLAKDVERAVGSRTIVRTWLMRGTLHFAAAGDVRWLLDVLGPRVIARSRRRDEQLGLDDRTYERSSEALTKALESREQLSRSEMMGTLEEAGISPAGQRGYHILRHLALQGLICFGPMVGREPSFVMLDDWVPEGRKIPRERALGELARRYFIGHGPASIQDLVWWSGMTISEARNAIEAARSHLVEETHEGTTYWSGPPGPLDRGEEAHFLPGFDEYIIGYRDRSAVLDGGHTKDVLSTNGIFYPTLVIDGQVRGTWRAVKDRRGVRVEARPFSRLSDPEMGSLEGAAARYGSFIGTSVTLTVRDDLCSTPKSCRER